MWVKTHTSPLLLMLVFVSLAICLYIEFSESANPAKACIKGAKQAAKTAKKAAKTNATTAKKAAKATFKASKSSIKTLFKSQKASAKGLTSSFQTSYCSGAGKKAKKCAKCYSGAYKIVAAGRKAVYTILAKGLFKWIMAQIKAYFKCQVAQIKGVAKCQAGNCFATSGSSSISPYNCNQLSLGCPPLGATGTTKGNNASSAAFASSSSVQSVFSVSGGSGAPGGGGATTPAGPVCSNPAGTAGILFDSTAAGATKITYSAGTTVQGSCPCSNNVVENFITFQAGGTTFTGPSATFPAATCPQPCICAANGTCYIGSTGMTLALSFYCQSAGVCGIYLAIQGCPAATTTDGIAIGSPTGAIAEQCAQIFNNPNVAPYANIPAGQATIYCGGCPAAPAAPTCTGPYTAAAGKK